MTYNIGGPRRNSRSGLDDIIKVLQENLPDVVILQEVVEWLDAEQCQHSQALTIARSLGYIQEAHFGPTLSMQAPLYPGKAIFAEAASHGWQEWRYGNAILSRWDLALLEDRSGGDKLQNLPLFCPARYEGNRDTEPRHALLARIKTPVVSPFIIGTHLSTLVGERDGAERRATGELALRNQSHERGEEKAEGSDQAQETCVEQSRRARLDQTRRLIDLIRENVLGSGELVFLMGDFNATVSEPCIADVLVAGAGFVRLVPENDRVPTHRFRVKEPIDHILVYPASRLVDYQCKIVDTPLARQASDHLPVVAQVTVI